MQLEFTYAWQEDPPKTSLPAHQSTWADLKIGVGDKIFTSNCPLNDDEDTRPRDVITVSVFPLAEFIAANWWPLLHEPLEKEKLLRYAKRDTQAFGQRHWINKYTDGFAYPAIGFFGADTSVRIIARPSHIESAGIDFPVSSGNDNTRWNGLERNIVETKLIDFLGETTERLPTSDDKIWLKDVIARIRHTRSDPDEALYCHCAGLLGADPYEPGNELHNAIKQTISILGQDVGMEIFATAETSDVAGRAQWLKKAYDSIHKSCAVADRVHALKHKLLEEIPWTDKPWERGYALAQHLRKTLDLSPDMPMLTVESLTQAVFDVSGDFVHNIQSLEAHSGARGIVNKDRAGFGIAINGGEQRRTPQFQIAASFADFLSSKNDGIFLSTSTSTDRQKSNRAFAAEFLAPIEGIEDKWSWKKSQEKNFDDIANVFGISSFIVKYQVQNQAEHLLRATD